MDFITHCYYSDMRPFRDRPDIVVRGKWQWSPPGAIVIPYAHVFGSYTTDYDGATEILPVGEVPRSYGATSGRADPRLLGQNFCGDEEAWTEGVLYADRNRYARDAQGISICCRAGPLLPGGILWDGDAEITRPDDGAVDVLGAGSEIHEPVYAGAADAASAAMDVPLLPGAVDLLGCVTSDINALSGAGDVLAAGTDETPPLAGVGDVLGGDVSHPPVLAVGRVGVRGSAWTGRTGSPTAVARVGVRGSAWTGRTGSPTAVGRVGVRGEA